MKIPQIEILSTYTYNGQLNREGSLCNAYSPLKNLEDDNLTLKDFTTDKLNFDLLHPVDIILQDSYDGAVNMVLNDGKNEPRLINSRFSVIDDNKFKIPVHTGHKNTNIYSEETFKIDTSLKAIALKIPQIKYEGLTLFAGSLPCGAYTFYFKVADADGNESEVLAESGIVQVYIGGNSYPDINVRMGLEDENSGKAVNFTLTNLDTGFDYIHVLYARSSSGNDQAAADTYHKILFDYPITKGECKITITGQELISLISAEELYTDYADIESVKSQAVVNNVLFFGNVKKQEHDWDALRIASWKIGYKCEQKSNIGTINKNYEFLDNESLDTRGCYYNTYNTYYRVGYWPDEIYRFGIVYIFNDNSLSPVFNIQGSDLNLLKDRDYSFDKELLFQNTENGYKQWKLAPEDYYFDKQFRANSKGVIKFPSNFKSFNTTTGGIITPQPIYIKFDLSYIGTDTYKDSNVDIKSVTSFFEKHKIKGFFFVRQKRIPTILAQGIAIGLTEKDNGALPVIKFNGGYQSLSFLLDQLLIQQEGKNIQVPAANVKVNALLVPDAELSEATFNQLFVSNKHALYKIGLYYFDNSSNQSYVVKITDSSNKHKRKLTNVPEDIKIQTDGEMYFSTMSGNPAEAYKTSDVKYVWNKTQPQLLTTSQTLVRGQWGAFVGVGDNSDDNNTLSYGGIYNIKKENYYDDEEAAINLDFQLRMEREDAYRAICDRTEFNSDNLQISCYRGDCFLSLFTHRVLRNFIDPELPTNDKIINPSCWAQNYAVRCTAIANIGAKYNVYPEDDGWCIDPQSLYANEIATSFEIKESGLYSDWSWDPTHQYWYKGTSENPDDIAQQIGGTLTVADYIYNKNLIKLVKPSEQESGVGGMLKNIFKSSRWALRGLTDINRADVNAVGLGQWITFPICSAKNLALRDIDYSNATEQAAFNKKRSFYPLQKMDIHNPLRDSNVINQAAGISIPHKRYYIIPDVPFIKQEYFTRILNSLRDSAESITNEFKVMLESAYRDYTKIHGPITKLVPMGSKMIVVFHHGIGLLSLNDSMSQAENALGYLPIELSLTLSPDYGSMWKDSIISTPKGIYGIDTVAKVIWKIIPSDVPQLLLISNLKVQKFLIDSINLSEFTNTPFVGRINVKSHYNAFKQDVMFTYYNDILYKFDKDLNLTLSDYDITSDGYLLKDGKLTEYKGEKVKAYYDDKSGLVMTYSKQIEEKPELYNTIFKWATGKSWSICFNEILEKFVTFYDWIPVESENIDNIWFTFDRNATNNLIDLGYRNELLTYIKPIKEYEYGGTDNNYLLNELDPTFNQTVSITYFSNQHKEIQFLSIHYTDKDSVLIAGFYLKNGCEYSFYVNNRLVNQQLFNGTGWTFVTIRIYGSGEIMNSEKTIKVLAGTLLNEDIKYSDLAISDIITNTFNPNTLSKNIPTGISIYLPSTDIAEYYSVRTLQNSLPLWKHGFAGIYDNAEDLKPTFWYGEQHEFNFEFIVRKDAIHKVFNNLLIVSNKAEPHKFEFEVVGEAYEWHKYKSILKQIADRVTVATDHPDYKMLLDEEFKKELTKYPKLPYLTVTDACVPTLDPQIIGEKKPINKDHSDNTVNCCLVYDKQLNEFRVHTEQLGNDVWKYGRLKGNMQYLEDLWRIEIRPVSFKWVYLENGELMFSRIQETRHRDKYIKIKVRYSGEDLAVIQAISTLFDYSYA